MNFREDLEKLIRKHKKDKESDTPVHILVDYLEVCLLNFDLRIIAREEWYGNKKGEKREWVTKESK